MPFGQLARAVATGKLAPMNYILDIGIQWLPARHRRRRKRHARRPRRRARHRARTRERRTVGTRARRRTCVAVHRRCVPARVRRSRAALRLARLRARLRTRGREQRGLARGLSRRRAGRARAARRKRRLHDRARRAWRRIRRDRRARHGQHRGVAGRGGRVPHRGRLRLPERRRSQRRVARPARGRSSSTRARRPRDRRRHGRARCSRAPARRIATVSSCGFAPRTRPAYATLAPTVFEFHDHPVAARLLKRAALEIERLVAALDTAGALPVALCGGLAAPYEPFVPAVLRERVRAPRADSAAGALELARRAASRIRGCRQPRRDKITSFAAPQRQSCTRSSLLISTVRF